jgi:hypothetical protein
MPKTIGKIIFPSSLIVEPKVNVVYEFFVSGKVGSSDRNGHEEARIYNAAMTS